MLAFVIVVLSIALGVGLAGVRVPLLGLLFGRGTEITTGPVVVEGVQRLDRLATVRWTESVVVTKESDGSSLERFLTGEKIVLVAAGEVEAGVDLANLTSDDVEVDGETVTIRLPEPEILSASIDEGRTAVYDRDQGLLRLHPDEAMVGDAGTRKKRLRPPPGRTVSWTTRGRTPKRASELSSSPWGSRKSSSWSSCRSYSRHCSRSIEPPRPLRVLRLTTVLYMLSRSRAPGIAPFPEIGHPGSTRNRAGFFTRLT